MNAYCTVSRLNSESFSVPCCTSAKAGKLSWQSYHVLHDHIRFSYLAQRLVSGPQEQICWSKVLSSSRLIPRMLSAFDLNAAHYFRPQLSQDAYFLLLQLLVIICSINTIQVVSPFQAILDYEISKGIPPGYINYCISQTKPNGWWHRLERGEGLMDAEWFAGFTSDLHDDQRWADYYASKRASLNLPKETPPLPTIDGELLFWDMMRASRDPDPWMFPALKVLKASGKYILGALSNTMIFPPDHPYSHVAHDGVKSVFDVFISSAHVGLRKPDPAIYALAVSELDKFAKANQDSEKGKQLGWKDGVGAEEVVFLDDIGENLKAAKAAGFGTIKVHLGRAFEAVDALEELTGLKLAGDHPRIAVTPKAKL